MRRRPELTVLLSPGTPRPGQVLDVEARFESKSETPLERVSFDLVGIEKVTVQRGRNTVSWRHPHFHLRAEHPGKPLTPGLHTYRAQFHIPRDLPPQYWGRYAWVDYTLEVRASIPWWPDKVGRYNVPIAQHPVPVASKPGVFVSEYGGAKADELYAELSLGATTLEPGDELVGTVAFTNASRERGAKVALVAFERLFADAGFFQGGSIRETLEVRRWVYPIAKGAPEEGRGLPFRFEIARDTVPGFAGTITALEWAVEVSTERTFSTRTVLRAPIAIVPRAEGRRRSPTLVPAVGRERRAQSFQRVGERAGLAYDAEHDDLRGAVGAIGVRIGVETRPDGALATVAHLAWPSAGMGLRIAPGSWTDRLSPSEIDVGHEEFDRRFHVKSRVPDQARAVLDAELCGLLMQFAEVLADDDGAIFSVAMALADEGPLAELVQRTVGAAKAFEAGFTRMPPPPTMAAHAAAWRAWADRFGGRFEIGRCAVHDAALGMERVELVTCWSDDGQFLSTLVRVPLGVRIDPDAVSPQARAHADALRAETGARVEIAPDAIELTLDRIVDDPQSLDPLLENVTRLVHAVRGRGAAGPFR